MNIRKQTNLSRQNTLDKAAKILMDSIENNGFKTTLKAVFEMPLVLDLRFSDGILNSSIDDYGFSNRVKNSLHRTGRDTIAGIVEAIRNDSLSQTRGLGKKCETEIKTALVDLSWSGLSPAERFGFCRNILEHNAIRKP